MSVYYADAHRVGLRLNLFECDDEPQPATDHLEFSSHRITFTVDRISTVCNELDPLSICLDEEKEAKVWERAELSGSERAAKETSLESPSQPSGDWRGEAE